jgi:hypothetical protein
MTNTDAVYAELRAIAEECIRRRQADTAVKPVARRPKPTKEARNARPSKTQ